MVCGPSLVFSFGPVRPITTPKLHTKQARPPGRLTSNPDPRNKLASPPKGSREEATQEGADLETFFSSLVEYFKIS